MCQLCTGRQAAYMPDPWTERRKAEVLAELRRATGEQLPGVNRIRWMLPATTATSTTTTWRYEP